MDDARRLARSVEHIELSADPCFADLYIEQILFPATDDAPSWTSVSTGSDRTIDGHAAGLPSAGRT